MRILSVRILENFEKAMTEAQIPVVPEPYGSLPLTQPLEMMFCSGAGGWGTMLTLYPDGSFSGEFTDSDMGTADESYPNGIQYISRFHGSFGDFEKLSDASWALTLQELTLDTEYPAGEEWIEDGVRYISSEPYGLDGNDGSALKPGAVFQLYTPEAAGHTEGTEMYGAARFLMWMPYRREFRSAEDRLGCYGLHNLETGYGFFSMDAWE